MQEETCASDESLIESLESIAWSTDSKDNELYYLCWDSDEEMLVIGEDDNRGIASGGGSGDDSIDAGNTHHSAGNNSTADGGGCCGDEDGAGANSNKGADCSITGKEVLVPPLEQQQENTKEGPSLRSIVPRKSCWCPHDTNLNHFDTVLGLESEDQAIYCGVSKKNGQGFYLHGRNCAYCSAKFVVN